MAVKLNRTSEVALNGVKVLVYGQAGAGKTTLLATLPDVVVMSAEAGLLSIADADLPYIEIKSIADLRDAYAWARDSDEAKQFKSVGIDSISEIAEVVLAYEKKASKDPRQAYGQMQEEMAEIIRAFRDLPGRNIYMSAKVEKTQDEMGRMLYAP